MSHFAVLVLLNEQFPIDVNKAEALIEGPLAPYSEHIEVVPYEKDCYCVGLKARNSAREIAEVEVGKTIAEFRDEYWAMPEDKRPEFDEYIKPLTEAKDRLEKEHELYNKPDPECEDCEGSGKRLSTYNPNSQWDWYQVGGRWTGVYSGYEPEKDPKNIETCFICGGTGVRYDDVVQGKCNGCSGKGTRVSWPTGWKNHPGDILPVAEIIKVYEEKGPLFAVLTPESEWIESGKMGWWGMVSDEKDEDVWKKQFKTVLEKYKDSVGVVVDCHI